MNKKLLFSIPLITCCLTSCVGKQHYSANQYVVPVEWSDVSKDFRILHLCDIHQSQSDDYERHFKMLHHTITEADPNLIVLNGDTFTFADKKVVNRLFYFIDSYNIPWTWTFGNHDDQGYFADTYIQRLLAGNKFKNVKFVNLEDDDVTGRSNFVLNIRHTDVSAKTIETLFQVYCLDSHSYNFNTLDYDFIKKDQIDWYERVVRATTERQGRVIPSAMYFHIALPEFYTAGELANAGDPSVKSLVEGATTDEFLGGPTPESDTHLFDKVKELGSTLAISCAHDHINDSVLEYQGIALCFGVHATDRIYFDPNKIGGQVISVSHEDQTKLSYENIYATYEELEDK